MSSVRDALLGLRPAREGDGVTTLELFFDLVYVLAFTQVSALLAHGDPPGSLLDAFVVLALLWWVWCSYAWLANGARADAGVVRSALVLATAAMFVASLAIPEAFHDLPGGLHGPLVLVVCYAMVRAVHLGVYLVVAGEDRRLRRQVLLSLASSAVPATALLAVGVALGEPWQRPVWVLAVLYDLTVIFVTSRGGGGWVLTSAAHFGERHGLVVILALGESLVAIGVGAAEQPVSAPLLGISVLAVAASVGLWLTYFQRSAPVLHAALEAREGSARAHLARDLFTYLHLPVVAGIILGAYGVEQAVAHVADDHVGARAAWSMAAGVALSLGAMAVAERRAGTPWPWERVGPPVVLLALAGVLAHAPAAVLLAVTAATLVAGAVVRPRSTSRADGGAVRA
ncbi:low temperature requirement protein A [Phycicoccus sp. MAQZ13P-2]|uniref:low temperature requirement protein A n=1 Tax=Phycicoccus mangrovi TaxID=2840470 RepID=UPI001C000AA4|nr:low temperature requirement protein A [Phycicoccus mangrovi]MBT9257977.1 low temperature requirement protein A [Phycicoccus mangrovi]MBT9276241.1 low temperature requirement protein A [Phycicoccus mangrovi]